MVGSRPNPSEVLLQAASDRRVVGRYFDLIAPPTDGCACWQWLGAISGRGHGRFWVGGGRVVIAHRLGWVIAHPDEQIPAVVCHECDNPGCQNPGHLHAGSLSRNRRDYVARVGVPGSPLNDTRGARGRVQALRQAARERTDMHAAIQAGWSDLDRYQTPLW